MICQMQDASGGNGENIALHQKYKEACYEFKAIK